MTPIILWLQQYDGKSRARREKKASKLKKKSTNIS